MTPSIAWLLVRYNPCQNFSVHYNYQRTLPKAIGLYDLALLKLEDEFSLPADGVSRLIWSCNRRSPYKFGTVIGIGPSYSDEDRQAKQLLEANMTFISESFDVRDKLQLEYTIKDDRSVWVGQPGDPIVLKEEGQVKCLIGIASFNARRTHSGYRRYHTIFTSALTLRNWIWRQIKLFHKHHECKSFDDSCRP